MNYFIDSSAWIEYFKGNNKYVFLSDYIISNTICTNEIILTELLPAIVHRKEQKLAELLSMVKKYDLFIDWMEVRNMQLLNLKHGNNNIGITDIIIAQNCIQNDLVIIAEDKHFKAMAKYMPIRIYDT
jgi:predicted nucleic acid-binding protein